MENSQALVAAPERSLSKHTALEHDFVTMRLDGQLFGISVMAVQDVLRKLKLSPVPLAPTVVAGSLNIRGRIVTAIAMRTRLGIEENDCLKNTMYVVVEYQQELYALMVDSVGDVLNLPMSKLEKSPANLTSNWRSVSSGVFKLEDELLVVLDVAALVEGINA